MRVTVASYGRLPLLGANAVEDRVCVRYSHLSSYENQFATARGLDLIIFRSLENIYESRE